MPVSANASDHVAKTHVPFHLVVGLPGTGKTTSLDAWVDSVKAKGGKVYGVVAPIVDGLRHMKVLSTGESRLHQLNIVTDQDREEQKHRQEAMQAAQQTGKGTVGVPASMESPAAKTFAASYLGNCLVVGPYVFDTDVFNWANEEVCVGLNIDADWIVLDEIGPLEVRKKQGLHCAMLACAGKVLNTGDVSGRVLDNTKVVIVCRPQIVDEMLQVYGIPANACAPFDQL